MLCTSAHIFQSMPVLEIQMSSWDLLHTTTLDNITDLLKLRPNFCPKVDKEVKIIVKVVKIIGEKNIPMYLRFCVVIVISWF